MKQYRFLNPGIEIFLEKANAYQLLDTNFGQRIIEDLENYRIYYSGNRWPNHVCRSINKMKFMLIVFIFVIVSLYFFIFETGVSHDNGNGYFLSPEVVHLSDTVSCAKESSYQANDVNHVRPENIEFIAALGDSITTGYGSKNSADDRFRESYFGNSYVTGGDDDTMPNLSVAKILRKFNPSIKGFSYGVGYGENIGLNVAVSGRTCEDLTRQASLLVNRFNEAYEPEEFLNKWKLINIFIGTNDIGNLSCTRTAPPIPKNKYKMNIEEAIAILKKELPYSIVSIIGMWNPQAAIEATNIIKDSKRRTCADSDDSVTKREKLCDDYRAAAYEIQNEKKFDDDNFTVVVQSFMDDVKTPVKDSNGRYITAFYGDDYFHLSKYGNVMFASWLWNNLLEPVGSKKKNAPKNYENSLLYCPDETVPYIRTLGNSM